MNAMISEQTLDTEEYAALARALSWVEGFGAFFVECSPVQGRELVTRLTNQLEKRCQLVELQSEIKDLRQYILQLPDYQTIQVLFIVGLEKSFEPYIKAGYGGEGDYYKEDTPVPVLGRLNLDREVLRRDLPQLAVVFMLPRFGIKYFIRRAPDFFDWRSGWFHFATEKSLLSQLIAEKTAIDYNIYLQQSVTERQARLLELADLLEEPAQTDEEKTQLYREMGKILESLERYEEAITSCDKAIAVNPNFDLAWNNRGNSLNKLERYEEAIVSYDKVIAINPNRDWAWYRRGYSLSQLGRYEEAIASCDKAVAINPNRSWAWYRRGYSLHQLGRYEEAITSYDKAIAINPNHDSAWYQRSYSLYQLGRYEEAIASCDKAIAIEPNHCWAWYRRGYSLHQLGRYEEAITSYDKAIAINPNHDSAWYQLGYSLSQLKRYEEAITSYDKAIAINPNHDWAWYRRGYSLDELGHYGEAIVSYDKAIAINPNHNWVWSQRGRTLWKQWRVSEAADSFAKALEIAPNNLSALSNDIALALVQYDIPRMQQRLAVALPLLKSNSDGFAVLPFLQWLAAPETSPQSILSAIQQLEPTVEINWDFSYSQPSIDRLTPAQQTIAYAFIDFFKSQCDFATLQQRINTA